MDGNGAIYFSVTMLIIAFVLIFSIVFYEIAGIVILGIRVENSTIASGWAGFSELDLIETGKRLSISDEEARDIYLNKNEAEEIVRDYLKKNLKLDDNLFALNESYIGNKEKPVVIEEITIYNPDDLPATTSDGTNITRTTIHIRLLIPKDIKGVGFKYLPKSELVDIDSFIAEHQK